MIMKLLSLLGWKGPPPEPRCFRCGAPAEREYTAYGHTYGFCWEHIESMWLLIKLSECRRRRCRGTGA